MDRPAQILLLLGAGLFCEKTAGAQPAAPVTTPVEIEVAPRPEHAISPHIAALLAASRPKLEAPVAAEKKTEQPAVAADEPKIPANGIVRLPRYVVREPRLPSREEVMNRKESENDAMNRFIGPEDGFDRGFLNLFTIAGLWEKIPVLGRFPFVSSETNAERGMRLYAEAERKRKMEELMSFTSLTKEAGDTAGANNIKHETEKTFIRRADFGK
jgi:hypothetical protein